jgi:hypothetical protein
MVRKFHATFDGETLRPHAPVDLKPNGHYIVTVDEAPTQEARPESPYILDQIAALATDMGVTDLAERHTEYALGTLKLPERPDDATGPDPR